jgi:surfeit locus 1 family protein
LLLFFRKEVLSSFMTRPIVSASLATATAAVILVSLGVWQLHRLHWKQGLLAQIEAATHAAPVALPNGGKPALFTRVIAHGVLRGDRIALYGAEVRDDRMGAQAIEVLDRAGAGPLLVDLGWVPTDRGRPAPIRGPAEVTGYIRLAEKPSFLSAPNDLVGLHFYTLEPSAIGAALGAPDAAPFTLVALKGAPISPGSPEPAEGFPEPPNNHLQYALTWFGLAGALIGVFGVWVWGRR